MSISGTDVIFTPTANFNGAASFDYTVTDNGTTNGIADPQSANATATFTITAVNDAPVFAHFGTNHSTGTEQTFGIIRGAATVSDVELDALNGGIGNYAGASLIVGRSGAANPEDTFGFSSANTADCHSQWRRPVRRRAAVRHLLDPRQRGRAGHHIGQLQQLEHAGDERAGQRRAAAHLLQEPERHAARQRDDAFHVQRRQYWRPGIGRQRQRHRQPDH